MSKPLIIHNSKRTARLHERHPSSIARMAASVIRTLSNLGFTKPFPPSFFPAEDEEETEEEYEEELREDSLEEEEDGVASESQEEEPWSFDPSPNNTEMTNQLLRFAELISNDVQRYFGRSQDPDACDIYAERPCPKVGGRQRYYADFIKVASSGHVEEPELLGPLAELFQDAQRKGRGLPMSQRRLPISFWTEPFAHRLDVLGDTSTQENSLSMIDTSESSINISTSLSMFSNTSVCTVTSSSVSGTLSSSSTPDFSDLLAHWAMDRENPSEFNCDYQLS
ncbi:protein PERCC1 [Megalobrama amblycephala]|uniref:protein PERCC1 n=1 Tax=Megalobrama amblycephala TaxID=75352 RepID=UPI002013D552|nr:protein PERCC1 [Megalobrama amblycephala]